RHSSTASLRRPPLLHLAFGLPALRRVGAHTSQDRTQRACRSIRPATCAGLLRVTRAIARVADQDQQLRHPVTIRNVAPAAPSWRRQTNRRCTVRSPATRPRFPPGQTRDQTSLSRRRLPYRSLPAPPVATFLLSHSEG